MQGGWGGSKDLKTRPRGAKIDFCKKQETSILSNCADKNSAIVLTPTTSQRANNRISHDIFIIDLSLG